MRKVDKIYMAVGVGAIAIGVSSVALTVYVVAHFVIKFW